MHTLFEFIVGDFTVRRELKELTNFLGDPNPVGGGIKLPYPELCGLRGNCNPLLELIQRSLLFKQVCHINA